MKKSKLKVLIFLFILYPAMIIRCKSKIPSIPSTSIQTPEVVAIPLLQSSFTQIAKPADTVTLTSSPVPSPSLEPSSSFTPSPTLTPTWIFNEPGKVIVPILLYHHIEEKNGNRYYVSPENFRAQMEVLQEWGYATIPISLLLDALVNGAELPQRPVVISFDDGNTSIYENAYPIMQNIGFVGVFYIVSNRLNAKGFVNVDQLNEMIAAGWEVGSHSQSHLDLTTNHDAAHTQMRQSKLDLENALETDIATFSYPFGAVDEYIGRKAQNYGYKAAVGLGKSWTHTRGDIYYLERIEIYGGYSIDDLAGLMPWAREDEE